MTPRQAVVTSLFGGYEKLGPQPVARDSTVDFLCFTDDPGIVSGDWRVVVVEPPFPLDPHRSQRYFKIVGESVLDQYDEILYIDNSVLLRIDPSQTLHEWLDSVDAAFVEHSYRETVLDEFEAVLLDNLDEPGRVHEQLLHYSLLHPEALTEIPSWNAIFAYRPSPAVRAVMSRWFWHVLRYSRRDQLSWNVAVGASTLRLRRIPLDNRSSELHAWPIDVGRTAGAAMARPAVGPLVLEVRRIDDERQVALTKLAQLEDEAARLRLERDDAVRASAGVAAEAHREIEAMRGTVSWIITSPLRRVRSIVGRRTSP